MRFAAHSAVSPRSAGRPHRPDDPQAEPRDPDRRRRTAAFIGHDTAGSPRMRSSQLSQPDDRLRVNAIVGSFKPKRSQSSERRLKSTLVLATLQQALPREATTSRRKSTSSQMAQSVSLELDSARPGAIAFVRQPPCAARCLWRRMDGADRTGQRLRGRSHATEPRDHRRARYVPRTLDMAPAEEGSLGGHTG